MDEFWELIRFKNRFVVLLTCLFFVKLDLYFCLNFEGLALLRFRDRVASDPFNALASWNDNEGAIDPCSWFGVECLDGNVVVLNLKDLCLGGTLAWELGQLVYIKSIILRNNTFSGIIPEGIGELKDLELLDLGYNNFSGPLPPDFGSNLSLGILLLDHNELLGGLSHKIYEFTTLSELQVDEEHLSNIAKRSASYIRDASWTIAKAEDVIHRRLLANAPPTQKESKSDVVLPPPPPPRSGLRPTDPEMRPLPEFPPMPSPSPMTEPNVGSSASPVSPPPASISTSSSPPSKQHIALILSLSIGGSVFIFLVAICLYRTKEVSPVRPWATGISGQLQKAFVTGVPKLKRGELETACEDFSNVIGSSSMGTVYKGTLSSGVEIAVVSVAATSATDWSRSLEAQFRNKIDTLSKVNHKNFVSLLGFCVEEQPFTRMMVFEYAPNGTLFEHLHIQEAEHLDWGTRVRILMGMAYCLDHMHQLTPPMPHKNLDSSAINLTEDFAAKLSDFGMWNKVTSTTTIESPRKCPSSTIISSLESNVYNFGVMLFEIITGRLPYSVDNSPEDWASDYLHGGPPLLEMVDPTLKSFDGEQLGRIEEVMKFCVHPNPRYRPTMKDVTERLREITGVAPDAATPKLSPLWWAELEILSVEGS